MSTEKHSVAVKCLREKIRTLRSTERSSKRETEWDCYRLGLGEISQKVTELESITVKDITGLASRIKRRKHADSDDMLRLSHGFLQSEDNIRTFIKIPGALNTLVKELTGSDAKAQINACETLCNLSLGDSIACEKIATAAGSYLITILDSSNLRLQKTSLWVITNILVTEGKGFEILLSQEILSKLIHLYCNNNPTIEFTEDLLVAVDILLEKHLELFSSEQLQDLGDHLKLVKIATGLQLKILFSVFFNSFNLKLCDENVIWPVSMIIKCLNAIKDLGSLDNLMSVLYSVRILGNLIIKSSTCIQIVESECCKLQTNFADLLNRMFNWKNLSLNRELLWLLANVSNSQISTIGSARILEFIRISKQASSVEVKNLYVL